MFNPETHFAHQFHIESHRKLFPYMILNLIIFPFPHISTIDAYKFSSLNGLCSVSMAACQLLLWSLISFLTLWLRVLWVKYWSCRRIYEQFPSISRSWTSCKIYNFLSKSDLKIFPLRAIVDAPYWFYDYYCCRIRMETAHMRKDRKSWSSIMYDEWSGLNIWNEASGEKKGNVHKSRDLRF